MTYYRIVIETLLPPGTQGKPLDKIGTHAVDQQFPVSDWMEIKEWYDLASAMRTSRPVHMVGLMLGFQTKEDGKPYPLQERLAAIKAASVNMKTLMVHFDKEVEERKSRRIDTERRIDEFVENFDFEVYGLRAVIS